MGTGPATHHANAGSSADLLAAHRDLRAAHGRLDNLRGAASVYQQAVTHHQQVMTWLRATHGAEQKQVAQIAAYTGGFTGFLAYDLGMPEAAAVQYREALSLAHRSGDVSAAANLLGQLSRILGDLGQHRPAADLSTRALTDAGTRAHPAARSWLHAVRAHHQAGRRNQAEAQEDLRKAWQLLERVEDGEKPPYIGHLAAAELSKWSGHTMIRLAADDASCVRTGRAAIDDALMSWPSSLVRGSAEVLASAARIHRVSGDLDRAGHFAERAVGLASQTRSVRNLRASLDAQQQITMTVSADLPRPHCAPGRWWR